MSDERLRNALARAEVDKQFQQTISQLSRALKKAEQERDEAWSIVGDAIDAMVQRGAKRNDCSNRPKTLLELVGEMMHDLLNVKGALTDYKTVYERLVRERDEAQAENERLKKYGVAQ